MSSPESSPPIRVVHLARRCAPAVGGVESLLRHITQAQSEHHDVVVLAHRVDSGPYDRLTDSLRPPPTFEPFCDGLVGVKPLRWDARARMTMAPLATQVIPVIRRYAYGRIRIPMSMLFGRATAPTIAGHLSAADLLHVWGGDQFAAAGVVAARRAGVPVVITPFVHAGQWNDDIASARAYRRADLVIGLLEDDCATLRSLGVSPERVVECGVCSPGVARGGGAAMRARYHIKGPLVLFLGVRRPYKGFDLLVEALPELSRRVPGVRVAFVGPGPAIAAPTATMLDIGAVDSRERAAWLDAADVLCLPSDGEIFPVTILEAWSASTAVLTSDIPPLRELMARSGGGTVAPRRADALAAALSTLLLDTDTLRDHAARGQAYWERHGTVEAVTRRLDDLYGTLVR